MPTSQGWEPWPVSLPSGSDRHTHGQSGGLPPTAAPEEELLCPCTHTSPTSTLHVWAAPGSAPLPSLCRRPARAPRSATHPSPMASRWDSSSDGRKTLRNSAEKMPPFFMTLVLRMLSVGARFGCLKSRNSLWGEGGQQAPAPGPRGPEAPGRRLTWPGGHSLADWTNPKSSLSFSLGCFRPLSSSP